MPLEMPLKKYLMKKDNTVILQIGFMKVLLNLGKMLEVG